MPRTFPKISPATWHNFLYIFKQESKNYPLESHKISIIRESLTCSLDKSACMALNSLDTILAYLYSRYGSFCDVSSQEIDDFIKNAKDYTAEGDQLFVML